MNRVNGLYALPMFWNSGKIEPDFHMVVWKIPNKFFTDVSKIYIIYMKTTEGHLYAQFPPELLLSLPVVNALLNDVSYPRPIASMWEMIKEGRKSFRKSADRTPPFFMTLVFLMLREVDRLGYFSRNSLQRRALIFHHRKLIKINKSRFNVNLTHLLLQMSYVLFSKSQLEISIKTIGLA